MNDLLYSDLSMWDFAAVLAVNVLVLAWVWVSAFRGTL